MPFTFSHPSIILPLLFLPRHWFSLTGLIIGYLTPDFEYFLRMRVQSEHSHAISGLFWFDLPLGILLSFVFHNIVRNSLYDNLPIILKSRLFIFKQFEWNTYFKNNWIVVIISTLIGATSHLFWDSFTHEYGYFVKISPLLATKISIFNLQVPIFKILQHSSTLLGAFILIVAFLKLPSDKNIRNEFSLRYWAILAIMTSIIVFCRLLAGLDYKLYGHVIVTIISAGLISLVLTPLLVKIKGLW